MRFGTGATGDATGSVRLGSYEELPGGPGAWAPSWFTDVGTGPGGDGLGPFGGLPGRRRGRDAVERAAGEAAGSPLGWLGV
ncbi:hypothetical protein [Streptomyces sp. NPDC049881]|uniref:hypothetical protein n=1 Tax=Streptomyces sp. NPDC049881 TaxID=3155778 RepID=UPI0034142EBD